MEQEIYVIHITKRCNMNCIYCYEKDKTSEYSVEEIKDYVDNMLRFSPKVFSVEFLGGEPCLEWDKVKEIYEYIEFNKNKDFTVPKYCITTNGTILNDEMVEYLKNNDKIIFAASLDGSAWANQLRLTKEGINSHDIVVDNLKRLLKENIELSVHMVTHPYNVGFIYESIHHLYSIGVRSIGVGTIESTIDIDENFCNRFIEELNRVSVDIVNNNLDGLQIDLFNRIKPVSDTRRYIKDDSGKVIGETYGRAGGDISDKDVYDVQKCDDNSSSNSIMINFIRHAVFVNHQKNISEGSN